MNQNYLINLKYEYLRGTCDMYEYEDVLILIFYSKKNNIFASTYTFISFMKKYLKISIF